MSTSAIPCGLCGGTVFSGQKVLWPGLINEWQLSPAEAAYVDRQQGEQCTQCGANLRSIALANAIRAHLSTDEVLIRAALSEEAKEIAILEINEAGMLTPVLKKFGRYVFGAYPEVDMHALPFESGTFDLVVHSDTLEHVSNPVHALTECRRVLKPGGALCFTVPVIVGRMTRTREGLPKSYHGGAATRADDFSVATEFGADAWTYVLEAGFTDVSIHTFAYPAATAFLAKRRGV